MTISKPLTVALASILMTACADLTAFTKPTASNMDVASTNRVVLSSEVEWTFLNPKRRDKAPLAGTLWGDRNAPGPTGFLLKPKDGFSSPPHIHNVSYRGVVIQGLLHNDDPTAKTMWLPAGSFWTQPKGEVHITSAIGSQVLAYIEIEDGPYLVMPESQAFDSGERPVNVDKSNIVWVNSRSVNWIEQASGANNEGAKVAFLWGKPQQEELNGSFLKLPPGFVGQIRSSASTFGAVVIQGTPQYQLEADLKQLDPGSYFSSQGNSVHLVSCASDDECIIYVRAKGKYEVTSNG